MTAPPPLPPPLPLGASVPPPMPPPMRNFVSLPPPSILPPPPLPPGGAPLPPIPGLPTVSAVPLHPHHPLSGKHANLDGRGQTTVILTHIPSFLCHVRALRDLIYPCGSCRHVAFSSEPKRDHYPQHLTKRITTGNGNSTQQTDKISMAVVKMNHATGAFNLCRNWNVAASRVAADTPPVLKDSQKNSSKPAKKPEKMMKAYFLTSDTEAIYSREADEGLVTKLVEAYRAIKIRQETTNRNDVSTSNAKDDVKASTAANESNDEKNIDADEKSASGKEEQWTAESDVSGGRKLDVSKVAAAAGGGAYDEEVDPLNAPKVLEAVALFKKKLEEKDAVQKRRRMEIVDKKLKVEVARIKKVLLEEREIARKRREKEEKEMEKTIGAQEMASAFLPPPPFPLPPPMPPGALGAAPALPPPPQPVLPEGVKDSGRRGVSNLPSWMTKSSLPVEGGDAKASVDMKDAPHAAAKSEVEDQPASLKRKFAISEANRDANTRKQRIDTGDGTSLAEIRAANQAADAAAGALHVASRVVAGETIAAPTILFTKEQILSPSASFPPLKDSSLADIRLFVTDQIVDYLGEEEKTLIDFVMNHLRKTNDQERSVFTLLDEMKMVLEEDGEAFVLDLYRKVSDLM